jgi:hypothetical protein
MSVPRSWSVSYGKWRVSAHCHDSNCNIILLANVAYLETVQ